MRKQILLFSAFVFILLSTFVIAERFESNLFRYAELDSSGNLIATSTPVTGVSVFGVICNDSSCSTTQGILYNGEFNVSTDNTILNYSTTLQSPFGYGIYFYKKGFIPYEVSANWAGTDSNDPVGPFTNYLTRQRDCKTSLSTPTISISGNNASITLSTISPINNSGPLAGIPSQISQYYNIDINVSATANGTTQTKTVSVPFSSSRTVQFNFTLPAGNHTLNITSSTNNDLCVNTLLSSSSTQTANFTISTTLPSDTTPPSQISGLNVTNRTASSITWNWTNPSNSDFNSSIIFLNGINVLNTSSQSYTASGLTPSTSYTLSIQTKDNSGNINTTAVTNTISTLASNTTSNITGNTTGIPFIFISSPVNNTNYTTTSILLNVSSPNATSINYTINGNNFTYTTPVTLTNLINGTNTLIVRTGNLNSTRTSTITFNINTTSNSGGSGGSGGNGGGSANNGNNNGNNQGTNLPTTNNKRFPDLTPENKKTFIDYAEYEKSLNTANNKKQSNSTDYLDYILPLMLLSSLVLLSALLFILLYRKKK